MGEDWWRDFVLMMVVGFGTGGRGGVPKIWCTPPPSSDNPTGPGGVYQVFSKEPNIFLAYSQFVRGSVTTPTFPRASHPYKLLYPHFLNLYPASPFWSPAKNPPTHSPPFLKRQVNCMLGSKKGTKQFRRLHAPEGPYRINQKSRLNILSPSLSLSQWKF